MLSYLLLPIIMEEGAVLLPWSTAGKSTETLLLVVEKGNFLSEALIHPC